MGKLIEVVEYSSRYASVILSAKVRATTYLLTCLVDDTSREKIQQTFSTQKNITQKEVQNVVYLNLYRN
jgi:hypothetical protein